MSVVVIDGEISLISNIDGEHGVYIDIGRQYEYYGGDYFAIPSVDAQIFSTENKVMTDDFTVHKIPYAETENLSGGYTVTIG